MQIQKASSDGFRCPLAAYRLPPEIVDRAANGLGWASLICAATCVALTSIQLLQPEFASAWSHPGLRLTSLGTCLLSIGLIGLQRSGRLSKHRMLDLAMLLQVAVAFAGGVFEGAAYKHPDVVVIGVSGVALWMMICGRLMPNAPLKTAVAGALSVAMWPLGYRLAAILYRYQPMPLRRMLVWLLPLAIIAIWNYVLNLRAISFFAEQKRAEDVGTYVLTLQLGKGGM